MTLDDLFRFKGYVKWTLIHAVEIMKFIVVLNPIHQMLARLFADTHLVDRTYIRLRQTHCFFTLAAEKQFKCFEELYCFEMQSHCNTIREAAKAKRFE